MPLIDFGNLRLANFHLQSENPNSQNNLPRQSSRECAGATSSVIDLEDREVHREKVYLASSSSRRAEILRAVAWPFEILPANIDESRLPGEQAIDYVRRLALAKAAAAASRLAEGLVLGADTIVLVGAEILGQPRDARDARRMLGLLRGKWHEVLTGVALVRAEEDGRCVVEHESTRVRFSQMSEAEIEWYISTKEPMDKAGAYAVQGRAALFIEEIQGDYFNIVGLPIRLVHQLSLRM
jgi:septum formation protein